MKTLTSLFFLLISVNLFAKCEVHYNRTACAGKDKESYSKCENSTKECTKVESAEDEDECKDKALSACSNSRVDITKSKIITAKWNGKELLTKTGKKDFCLEYEKRSTEFDKCK